MSEQPGYRPARIVRGLSLPRRVGQIGAGLGGLCGAILVAMLWATEPGGLPLRTQVGFAALVMIGVIWSAVAVSALVRRPLFAIDRVIAGWSAVAASILMTAGLLVIAMARGSTAGLVAGAGTGVALLSAASVALLRARAYRAAILARQRDLESTPP